MINVKSIVQIIFTICVAFAIGYVSTLSYASYAIVAVAAIPLVWLVICFPVSLLILLMFAGRFNNVFIFEYLPSFVNMATILLLLLMVVMVIRSEVNNLYPLFTSNYIAVFMQSLWILLCLLMSDNQTGYGIEKSLDFLFYVFLPVGLMSILLKSEKDFYTIFLFIVLIAFALDCLALSTINGSLFQQSTRISALGGGPIVFSRFLSFGVIICIMLFPVIKKPLLVAPIILLFVLGIILSGSRGTIIAIAASLIFVSLFRAITQKGITAKMKSLGVGFLLAGCMSLLVWIAVEYVQIPVLQRFMLLTQESKGESIELRVEYISAAFQQVLDNHPIVGYGPGGFGVVLYSTEEAMYPHNLFIEIFFELGLIGIGVILYLLHRLARTLREVMKLQLTLPQTYVLYTLLGFFAFSMITAQFSGDLYDNRWIWYSYGFIVAYTRILHSKEKST